NSSWNPAPGTELPSILFCNLIDLLCLCHKLRPRGAARVLLFTTPPNRVLTIVKEKNKRGSWGTNLDH
ncbi:hypothetical protein HAX54_011834, partial [Datura stramonium]|nr:hypothetical protein [Datura stramonium]